MPIDRGSEVDDEVASGPCSIVYDIVENSYMFKKPLWL